MNLNDRNNVPRFEANSAPRSLDIARERAMQAEKAQAAMQCAQTNEMPRDREIPEKISRLFAASDELSEKLARFGERLHGVLVPRPPESGNQTKVCCAPSATAMGDQLAQLQTRLYLMIDAVETLDATLEL